MPHPADAAPLALRAAADAGVAGDGARFLTKWPTVIAVRDGTLICARIQLVVIPNRRPLSAEEEGM